MCMCTEAWGMETTMTHCAGDGSVGLQGRGGCLIIYNEYCAPAAVCVLCLVEFVVHVSGIDRA